VPPRDVRLLSWGLLAACLLVYANTLAAGYTYDDKAIVRDNPRIRTSGGVDEIFATSYFGSPRGTAYRPVLLLSYAVQWWIHGKSAFAFHLVNVLVHAGCAILLLRLLLRLRVSAWAASGAAFLFAVLPIHVEAVAGLVGRGETLAALLVLAALLGGLWTLEPGRGRAARVLGLTAFLLLYAAALLTKESAVVLPGLFFLALAARAEGGGFSRTASALARGWSFYLLSAGILAGLFWLRATVLGGAVKSADIGIFELENPLAPLSVPARAANAAVLLLRGLGRTVLPLNLSADESAWSLAPVPALAPIAVASAVAIAGLAVAAVAGARRRPALAFGVLAFLVAALPTANLLFATGTIFAERLMYLPSAGICLCGGLLLSAARDRLSPRASQGALAVFGVALLLYAARTIVRNTAWIDDEALFAANVRTSPMSAKSHYNQGWVLGEAGRFEEARASYARAVEIYPQYWDAWAGKGRAEMERARFDDAAASYARAIAINKAHEGALFGAGMVEERRGDDRAALRIYREGVRLRPDSLPLAFRLATVRSRLAGENAEPDWRRALSLAPDSTSSRIGYARWLLAGGRASEAREQAREAVRRNPRLTDGWRLLAEVAAERAEALSELLARERAFRISQSAPDLEALLAAAGKCPACQERFARLRPGLRRLAPAAFRSVPPESEPAIPSGGRAPGS
jgi:tetratricopeptide (TPR) repeat protein